MSRFSRDDVKDFIQNFQEASWDDEKNGVRLLHECGCEDSEYGLYDSNTEIALGDPILPQTFEPLRSELAASAPCPDSYNMTIDAIIDVPHELVQMILPAMQEVGVGCPASFAKAVADVLTMSQDQGITPVFKK
tara:strand:- start:1954 stop:2355 length:402 start_codon:yes stop_codon:yes gene_type:complete